MKIISKLQKLRIEIQRTFDHTYRMIFGLPTLRRSKITPNLILGGQHSGSAIKAMKRLKVTAVVNMRLTSIYEKALKEADINYLNLPTPDLHAPTIEALKTGVGFIQKEIDNNGLVYIHCRHGEGRGPSMALAYLISQGLSLDDAIELVKKVRTFISLTPVQLERLKEFEKLYQDNSESK